MRGLEKSEVVAELYTKDAIVLDLDSRLQAQLVSPKWRCVTPVTLPLLRTPRIAQLQKPQRFPFVFEVENTKESVGMPSDDSLRSVVFGSAWT